jgi:hypothetical protein
MEDTFGTGDVARTNLRAFFAHAVVPAYTEVALSTPCGWILTDPMMIAIAHILQGIVFDMDGADSQSVSAVLGILLSVLHSIHASVSLLVIYTELLEWPTTLRVVIVYFMAINNTLRAFDYCLRLQPETSSEAPALVRSLRDIATFTFTIISGHADAVAPVDHEVGLFGDTKYQAIKRYAASGLQTALSSKWVRHGETYEIHGAGGTRRVETDLGSHEEEKTSLKNQLLVFCDWLECLPSFRDGNGVDFG